MAIAGNIDLWRDTFPSNRVPRILELVLDCWKTFSPPMDRYEVPITKAFCVHLRKRKNRSRLPLFIGFESWLLDENAVEIGRLDLRFSHGYLEDVYFSMECKRLRVPNASGGYHALASEYVKEGMMRYVTGQYAGGLDKGGMIGYVMDGLTGKAIDNVRAAIKRERDRVRLHEGSTWRKSSLVQSPQVRESLHAFGRTGTFVIHHVFLPL